MTVIIVLLIVVFSLLVIARSAGGSSRKQTNVGGGGRPGNGSSRQKSVPLFRGTPPEALGIPAEHPARKAAERLEAALSGDFEARVKDRVMKPALGIREEEWQWRWFELKRYFLMCGLLRSVPMYSEKVDDVWHEMLMFTREYEQFCKTFCGRLIHHAPHAPGAQPEQGERAWFDWVYGELFPLAWSSERLWGRFYKTRLPRQRIEEFELWDRNELLRQRFNTEAIEAHPDLAQAADYLLDRGSKLAVYARENKGRPYKRRDNTWDSDTVLMTGAMSGVFFASSLEPEHIFEQEMNQAREEGRQRDDSGSSGSYYACSSGDNGSNDGSRCGGGSDSGGSSGGDSGGGGSSCSSGGGSSCGSGCGSS
ncbi:hypothetical protein FHS18_002654 [Paenibacillus phyllosphaerae]|uniref:Uncharacterized protein n=1 Tax=Paenibacillus phyllosphaerae TaxID=274593 RepID=A0A7W5AXL0_9BACL|nr:hypothetical protein [Paenibacillus phyllosphaerae]MBB3110587.1 hypothetical protein [Paenibacillus phyllosphaerae]